jgi:hypothetical protein
MGWFRNSFRLLWGAAENLKLVPLVAGVFFPANVFQNGEVGSHDG